MLEEYENEYAQFLYYTPGELDKDGRLWPVRAGRSVAKPHYAVGPKRIECYSLHLVLDGRLRLEYGGTRQELEKNDLFCLFPGDTYYYGRLPSESPLRLNWLAVDGARAKPLLELAGITRAAPFRRQAVTPRVREAMEQTLRTLADLDRWRPSAALELQSSICDLFAGLVPDAASGPASEPSGWLRECLKFMELHATEGITVQQVAAFAGIHRSYFSHMFAGQVGMPPQQYIRMIRMEKAKRLLTGTDATVTEIALSLGYPNLYSFTRAFKSYYNASPLAVRSSGGEPAED